VSEAENKAELAENRLSGEPAWQKMTLFEWSAEREMRSGSGLRAECLNRAVICSLLKPNIKFQ